ncbi:MAG: EamA family transporter [Sutterella wadsworthensis]|nr:EamA family transporter [Sutterella wadsworthensis]
MNPRFMMILSMAIFGTLGLFVRNINVASGELALYRAVMAALFLTTVFLITKRRIEWTKIRKEVPILIASGVAVGINWILLFEAYKYTTISLATLSYYFAPVLVTAICPFLFKEKLTPKQIICFVMSTLGIVLITGIGGADGQNNLVGIMFGLGAAVFYASVILLNKFIKNVGGMDRTLLQFIAAILVLLPYVASTSGFSLGGLDTLGWSCLLVVGLVHTGITYTMYFSSLKDLPGQKVAILSYIDPLVAIAISVLVLGEAMTVTQMIGGALILGFTLWNELTPTKEG